jgi:hypothetical protein
MEAEEKHFSLSNTGIALSDYLFSIPKGKAVSELQLRYNFSLEDAEAEYFILKMLWKEFKKGKEIQ